MTKPNRRCETCEWWDRADEHYGTCHRYPPFDYDMENEIYTQPITETNYDWCGEYREKVKE